MVLSPRGLGRTFSELREPLAALIAAGAHRRRPMPGGGGPSASLRASLFRGVRPGLPPGSVLHVPEKGDVFVRDTGAPRGPSRGTILLLHGWMVPSDPHWLSVWWPLWRDGWRVIAMDARGHGRGPRPSEPFRLDDCAEDTAALIRHLDCGPVHLVGYSMGGTIAQILAYRYPGLLRGLVLCATASEFQTNAVMRSVWSGMGVWQLWLRLAPRSAWEAVIRPIVDGEPEVVAWMVGELRRGAAWDLAEAGREIGRFDSRPWLGSIEVPAAVMVTTFDLLVPPARQRALALALGAPIVELASDHLAPATTPRRFCEALRETLELVEPGRGEADLRASA